MSRPKIFLAINYVDYSDKVKRGRQSVAISVMEKIKPKNSIIASFNYPDDKVELPRSFLLFRMLRGDSQKDLGNDRRLPYITEILSLCSKAPGDYFGYINSDILLPKHFFDIFKEQHDAYIFHKKDIDPVRAKEFLEGNIKIVDKRPDGIDGFFFRRMWWVKNGNIFPKTLVLGETEWDTAYNTLIQNKIPDHVLRRELFHVVHDRVWNLDSRGAIHNTLIWKGVRDQYGLPVNLREKGK